MARVRHCYIPVIFTMILPLMSLKNAPSAGGKGAPQKSAIFSLFITISVFSVT